MRLEKQKFYTTRIIYKKMEVWYSTWQGQEVIADINKRMNKVRWKGKAMTTVRFAYVLKNERHYEHTTTVKCREWSNLVRSYKVKPRQGIAVWYRCWIFYRINSIYMDYRTAYLIWEKWSFLVQFFRLHRERKKSTDICYMDGKLSVMWSQSIWK